MTSVVLDTGVIVEYVDLRGAFHEAARALFNALLSGKLEALVPHAVLAETYAVARRIYEALGLPDADSRAAKLINWLYSLPSVRVEGVGLELALEAGRVKARYKLALTDCYVLALSKLSGCAAVFRAREREMQRALAELQREFKLVFLEDYAR